MNLLYEENQSFKEFLWVNKKSFKSVLNEKIQFFVNEKNKELTSYYLYEVSYKMIDLIFKNDVNGILALAEEQGDLWSKSSLHATIKLAWYEAFRECYWEFLSFYHDENKIEFIEIFKLEKELNNLLSTYLKQFLMNNMKDTYSETKNECTVFDGLRTPIIPLSDTIAILLFEATIDGNNTKQFLEKTLRHIKTNRYKTIIIDLTATVYMDHIVSKDLSDIISGLKILGCETILTGINADIVKTMVDLNIKVTGIIIKSNLKQALEEFMK